MIITSGGRYGAVLDACTITCLPVCDTLLRLAEHRFYRPFWTEEILKEAERAIAKRPQVGPARARKRTHQMHKAFPEAMVHHAGSLIFGLPDDEHVLAAAVKSEAQSIVTFNLKDFPHSICSLHDIEVIHPDAFLLDQFDLNPDRVRNVIYAQAGTTQAPALGIPVVLSSLHAHVPNFANSVGYQLWEDAKDLARLLKEFGVELMDDLPDDLQE